MFEIARQHQGIFASGGVARQINAFVIIKNLLAVTEMEVITRHGETIRNEPQGGTPASNTAGITIVLGAPAEGQCPDNYCTTADGLVCLSRPAIA